jgi:Tfp pilus assembly protein PilO
MATAVLDDELRQFGRMLHYCGILVTVLAATAAYSLLHAPTARAIAETATRIEEVMLSAENAPLIREYHQKVLNRLADVEQRIAAVEARVPDEAEAGAFLKELTQIAAEEQLILKDFQPHKPVVKTGYAEMDVTLKGQGSFASICKFLDRAEKMSRLAKVKALTVSAVDNPAEYPVDATLTIYFGIANPSGNEEARRE